LRSRSLPRAGDAARWGGGRAEDLRLSARSEPSRPSWTLGRPSPMASAPGCSIQARSALPSPMPRARVILGDSRAMPELDDATIDLVVTSPPYWHLTDYGCDGQIGHGQTLHEYLKDLHRVWAECARALRPGARLCVNVGDQFAR